MINSIRKIMALIMVMTIGIYAYAQSGTIPVPPAAASTQSDPKDQFVKNLKDFQPKLDEVNMRAKQNATKMPDYAKEAGTLNDMVKAFSGKLDKFDSTPKDQQSQLITSLQTDWTSIQSQYKKVNDLWDKSQPENGQDK
jgi:hypothetical protein